ncbi:MAG: DUF86 domain-containing protein [Chloroflexi bacterium]|nr:DUF86 domain-containing protein [Chloroflexota bacterium]MCY4247043.1 DUF86 domain-containing protein [Chloroflexota bacterium]
MSRIDTLKDLAHYREQILALAKQHKAHRIAVFGSLARGEMRDDSDIDFLVDFSADYALRDQLRLIVDLRELLGRPVDVAARHQLREELAANILAEAQPLGACELVEAAPMERNQLVYCNDILDRIDRIEDYTKGGYDEFLASMLIQDGVERAFMVIGEAVKRLDPALKNRYPHIPWRGFAGFRDMLAHQYERIRLEAVWAYIEESLPELKSAMLDMRAHLNKPS